MPVHESKHPARQEQSLRTERTRNDILQICERFGLAIYTREDLDGAGYYVRTPVGRFAVVHPSAPAHVLLRALTRHLEETNPEALSEIAVMLPSEP